MLSHKQIALLLVLGLGISIFTYTFVPVLEYINKFKYFMDHLESFLLEAGPWGVFYVFGLYVVCTVFMLPLWGFHISCGFVYGTLGSSLLISVTQALASGCAFSTSRYIVRPYIRGFLIKKYGNKFKAIDKAVGEQGLYIILLLRLSPLIPFGMNNYLCGCTEMKLWEFVIGTWLGVLPGTTAYCYMGSLGKEFAKENSGATLFQKMLMGVGVIAALVTIKFMSDLASKALKEAGIDDDNNDVTENKQNKKQD